MKKIILISIFALIFVALIAPTIDYSAVKAATLTPFVPTATKTPIPVPTATRTPIGLTPYWTPTATNTKRPTATPTRNPDCGELVWCTSTPISSTS